MKKAILALSLALFETSAQAETIYVPDDYARIQTAIDIATNGDEIVVRPGTYFENLVITKSIHVRSEMGPGVTTIDARELGSCVVFFEAPAPTRITGFTLTNGSGCSGSFLARGGAVCSIDSSPVVEGNRVIGNQVTGDGGGIYSRDSTITISDNTISDNEASWYNGGGIGCWNSTVTIVGNEIDFNRTPSNTGSGIFLSHCNATISGNKITDNTSGGEGAGIKIEDGLNTLLEDNSIERNDANGAGGGVIATGPTIFIRNVIRDNDAHGDGGGIRFSGGSAELIDNTISGNYAFGEGGGVKSIGTNVTLVTGNVFTQNFAEGEGGGMRLHELVGTTLISNNLFAENMAVGFGSGGKGGGFRVDGGSPQIVNNRVVGNIVYDRAGGIFLGYSTGAVVVGNEISGNRAPFHGGGMESQSTDTVYANNTFYANVGGETAGGLRVSGGTVVNSIFVGNIAIRGKQINVDGGNGPTILHCNIEGGWPGVNITDQVPAFVDPLGPDGIPGTLDDDLRISACAPGVDLGDDASLPPDTADVDGDGDVTEPLPIDLRGAPRQVGPVDLGCYEFQPGEADCASQVDCNSNGVRDDLDIANCDGSPWCLDCNGNGRPDVCDLTPTIDPVDTGRAYWRFEHGPGPVLDSGQHGLTGEPTGLAFTTDVPVHRIPQTGRLNAQALSLDGIGHVLVEDPFHLTSFGGDEPTDFTVEAWVRLDELAGPSPASDRQFLVQKKRLNVEGDFQEFSILVQGANIQQSMDFSYGKASGYTGRELVVTFSTAGQSWSVTSHLEIDDLEWHHISVAKNNGDSTVRFSIDGLFETVPHNPEIFVWRDGPFLIGAHTNTSGQFNQHLRGDIDELRVSAGVRPEYQLLAALRIGASADCNANLVPDDCDIANGTLADKDGDGYPDPCSRPKTSRRPGPPTGAGDRNAPQAGN